VVKALRTPEAGASRAERMQSPYAHVAPSHRVEASGKRAYKLLGRGRKLLHEMGYQGEDCRVLLKKPFSHTSWSPRPATYSPPHKPAEARGGKPQGIHHRATEDVARAPELKRRLCRRLQNAKGLETRHLAESPAAVGASISGDSTALTEPACTPRCLSRHSSRRRHGKAAEALCPYTPQSLVSRVT